MHIYIYILFSESGALLKCRLGDLVSFYLVMLPDGLLAEEGEGGPSCLRLIPVVHIPVARTQPYTLHKQLGDEVLLCAQVEE